MKKTFYTSFILSLVLSGVFSSNAYSQFEDVEKNKVKLEIEPGLFFNNGRSLNAFYLVTKDNNLGLGIYLMATDIPSSIANNIFDNFVDGTSTRLTQEYALNIRYRIRVSKNIQSNPYVGLLLGWENIRLNAPGFDEMNASTYIATPHIGYELYVYKKMLYLNPQIRFACYFGEDKSDESRAESFKSYLILPSISFGIRF